MTIYGINPSNNLSVIVALIILKFTDSNSLIKIFSLLKIMYRFEPKSVTVDYDMSQIKALKTCESFSKKPYIKIILKLEPILN